MKSALKGLAFLLLFSSQAVSQVQIQKSGNVVDTSQPQAQPTGAKNPPPTVQAIAPSLIFDEFPINHNMHITSDGNFYYTINGGSYTTGRIQKFDLAGNLIESDTILIDGRGLSYNYSDSSLYASLFQGDIVKITDLKFGLFTTVFTAAMHDAQASFAIAPDGSVFYDFVNGTLYIHDFTTGNVIDTLFNLGYGTGNYGGNAAVAVDSNYIYTWDATIRTVYVYDLLGNQVQTMVLDSGDNGHSISIANQLLFVSRDGNYATGTWYGYGNNPPMPAPVAALASSDSSFCGKQCIDFYDLSTNNPTSWQWLFPGADSTSSNVQNPTGICYNSYGSFDVTLIACNAAGCDTFIVPGLINEFANPPVPVITFSADTLISTSAYSYQWYLNSAPVPGATNQYFVFTQMGTYFVIVTDSNGCASSSSSVVLATGIHDAVSEALFIYPNPSDGSFILSGAAIKSEIKIYDLAGRVIYSDRVGSPDMHLQLNANDGIYFLEMSDNHKSIRKKIVLKN